MFRLLLTFTCLVVFCQGASFSPKPRLDGRIVGGQECGINEVPFQVSFQRSNSNSHFCGGSLIDSEYVLTAAHCVSGTKPSDVHVRVNSNDKTTGGEVLRVLDITAHPKYDSSNIDYDYALLRIEPTQQVTEFATLPEQDSDVDDGTTLTISGWGNTQSSGTNPKILRSVDVAKFNQKECNKAYNGGITDRMICAGFKEGGKDSCQGDSGGPIFAARTTELKGVVSWGYGCAQPRYPGVYARISVVIDWIHTVMGH